MARAMVVRRDSMSSVVATVASFSREERESVSADEGVIFERRWPREIGMAEGNALDAFSTRERSRGKSKREKRKEWQKCKRRTFIAPDLPSNTCPLSPSFAIVELASSPKSTKAISFLEGIIRTETKFAYLHKQVSKRARRRTISPTNPRDSAGDDSTKVNRRRRGKGCQDEPREDLLQIGLLRSVRQVLDEERRVWREVLVRHLYRLLLDGSSNGSSSVGGRGGRVRWGVGGGWRIDEREFVGGDGALSVRVCETGFLWEDVRLRDMSVGSGSWRRCGSSSEGWREGKKGEGGRTLLLLTFLDVLIDRVRSGLTDDSIWFGLRKRDLLYISTQTPAQVSLKGIEGSDAFPSRAGRRKRELRERRTMGFPYSGNPLTSFWALAAISLLAKEMKAWPRMRRLEWATTSRTSP
jgi:hypothetical protein